MGQDCETRKFPPEPRVDEALPLPASNYEASLDAAQTTPYRRMERNKIGREFGGGLSANSPGS